MALRRNLIITSAMTNSLSIAVAGAAGRMGRQLIAAGLAANHKITGGTEAAESANLSQDLGALAGVKAIGLKPVTDVVNAAANASVWIDFTVPAATLAALESLRHTAVHAVVIGTTGFTAEQEEAIAQAGKHFAIVKAGNFSLGVNLMTALTKIAAESLGPEWDIEILETHHRRKVDAPSGTALMLGEAAAEGRGQPLADLRQAPYDGPSAKRETGKIGFAVRRMGDVIGQHEATFGSEKELLTIGHTALDRSVFAEGAIEAARWAAKAEPGYYNMEDVLGLSL